MKDAIVLFGATGDLSRQKIIPAISSLVELGKLDASIEIIGIASRDLTRDEFLEFTHAPQPIRNQLDYISGNFNAPVTYERLKQRLEGKKDVVFYLATPPSYYGTIVVQLARAGFSNRDETSAFAGGGSGDNGFPRIIIEKPFGTDLESTRKLNAAILRYFDESRIYRIDHYLGKETVQNISAFRFSNGIFEPIWNRRYIEYVSISVTEKIGIENRGKYFEEAGILRDIVQNHLFQILALIAMEPPPVFDADSVRDEKLKVFKSIRKIDLNDVVRGQYKGYLDEANVAKDSSVETYVAARLFIDNWRWAGVPFYFRTGKKLAEKKTEVIITFRQPPLNMFSRLTDNMCGMPNQLVLRLQPGESISIRFGVKKPGIGMEMAGVDMKFNYSDYLSEKSASDYERLLLDCFHGDLTLFARNDGVEECWKIIDPLEESWQRDAGGLNIYECGAWGPDVSGIFKNKCHGF